MVRDMRKQPVRVQSALPRFRLDAYARVGSLRSEISPAEGEILLLLAPVVRRLVQQVSAVVLDDVIVFFSVHREIDPVISGQETSCRRLLVKAALFRPAGGYKQRINRFPVPVYGQRLFLLVDQKPVLTPGRFGFQL